jgi:DNA modification methylase
LASRAITNSTQQGESVLDMFMGSGTTLIASDMLNRVSYGMEFGEKFCDMITLRFAKYKSDSNSEFCIYRNGQNITNEILEQLEKYKDLKLNQISMPEIEVSSIEE